MARFAGVDIPDNKRIEVALTYVFGIGDTNVHTVLQSAKVDPDKRSKELTAEEISRIQKVLDTMKIEGDLRKEVRENIQRLKRVGSYRGMRHSAGLPARGQRTRVNARTKRGKRMTVGAMKKDDMLKKDQG